MQFQLSRLKTVKFDFAFFVYLINNIYYQIVFKFRSLSKLNQLYKFFLNFLLQLIITLKKILVIKYLHICFSFIDLISSITIKEYLLFLLVNNNNNSINNIIDNVFITLKISLAPMIFPFAKSSLVRDKYIVRVQVYRHIPQPINLYCRIQIDLYFVLKK